MKRLILTAVTGMVVGLATQHDLTEARTRVAQAQIGPIREPSQLQLPSSAFPSGYSTDSGSAWTAARADTSTFAGMHNTPYSVLGAQGGWYQYSAKVILAPSGNATVASPVEMVYLGMLYPDETAAVKAYLDVVPRATLTNPVPCSYGAHCVTYKIALTFNGVPYSGVVRILQEKNAVAEVRGDVFNELYDRVGSDEFNANLDRAAQAFVQMVDASSPASTAVPATATSTPVPSTATPPPTTTSTATSTATPTRTSTPVPLFVRLGLAKKSVKAGSKQTVSVTTLPSIHVDVVVTFPTGAKKRHSGTADQDGAYTWSYRQPNGTTVSAKRTATVRVTVANAAGEQMQSSASYRISS